MSTYKIGFSGEIKKNINTYWMNIKCLICRLYPIVTIYAPALFRWVSSVGLLYSICSKNLNLINISFKQ